MNLKPPALVALLLALPVAAHAHAGDHSGMIARLADHLMQSPDHLVGLAIVFGIALTAIRAVHVWQRRQKASGDRH